MRPIFLHRRVRGEHNAPSWRGRLRRALLAAGWGACFAVIGFGILRILVTGAP